MQHVFSHQNPYHQPDWQHHPQAAHNHNHYAAQTQAAAAANAVAQQQNYGRNMAAAGHNGGNPGGLGAAANGAGNGMNSAGGPLGGGGPGEHGGGMGSGDSISEDNRRVLMWISQVLSPDTREQALLELSKKREQVPELALILWHSFGESGRRTSTETILIPLRRHDVSFTRDYLGLPSAESVTTHGCRL